MTHDIASILLLIGASFALFSTVIVLIAAALRVIINRKVKSNAAEEEAIRSKLILAALNPSKVTLNFGWAKNSLTLARVLGQVAELVDDRLKENMINAAAICGVEHGILKLAKSRNESDRLISASLLSSFPTLSRYLLNMARTDKSIIVRCNAILSLNSVGRALPAKYWSKWVNLGAANPHIAIISLLKVESLTSKAALVNALFHKNASPILKGWVFQILAKDYGEQIYDISYKILSDANSSTHIVKVVLENIADARLPMELHQKFVSAENWDIRAAYCDCILRLYAFELLDSLFPLSKDKDWRVRNKAINAIKVLSGIGEHKYPKDVVARLYENATHPDFSAATFTEEEKSQHDYVLYGKAS